MSRNKGTELLTEAEGATVRLRLGIKKSKSIVAQYRARLLALREAGRRSPDARSIFRFNRPR